MTTKYCDRRPASHEILDIAYNAHIHTRYSTRRQISKNNENNDSKLMESWGAKSSVYLGSHHSLDH
ncbi:hypothetical protein E2C01_011650 [Portunus trituberculatus]|uniref:Uncharacterized protein n=1 Tax=Portunus trituberculatus TaxID=210409 RepID=A0A5B7DC06_PORTR|nr:hypothetical protein [Portunus trituberculatus]